MPQAKKDLPATSKPINRRAVLRGGTTAAAILATPPMTAKATPRLAAKPSALGLALIQAATEYREKFNAAPDALRKITSSTAPSIELSGE